MPINKITKEEILAFIEDAERPVSSKEIAEWFGKKSANSVKHQVHTLKRNGQIIEVLNHRWLGSRGILAQAPDAFATLIWLYERIDPSHAKLLNHDRDNFFHGKLSKEKSNGKEKIHTP